MVLLGREFTIQGRWGGRGGGRRRENLGISLCQCRAGNPHGRRSLPYQCPVLVCAILYAIHYSVLRTLAGSETLLRLVFIVQCAHGLAGPTRGSRRTKGTFEVHMRSVFIHQHQPLVTHTITSFDRFTYAVSSNCLSLGEAGPAAETRSGGPFGSPHSHSLSSSTPQCSTRFRPSERSEITTTAILRQSQSFLTHGPDPPLRAAQVRIGGGSRANWRRKNVRASS